MRIEEWKIVEKRVHICERTTDNKDYYVLNY